MLLLLPCPCAANLSLFEAMRDEFNTSCIFAEQCKGLNYFWSKIIAWFIFNSKIGHEYSIEFYTRIYNLPFILFSVYILCTYVILFREWEHNTSVTESKFCTHVTFWRWIIIQSQSLLKNNKNPISITCSLGLIS
jgi:hypothetical protein